MLLLKAGALEHVSSLSTQFSWAVLTSPGYVRGLRAHDTISELASPSAHL